MGKIRISFMGSLRAEWVKIKTPNFLLLSSLNHFFPIHLTTFQKINHPRFILLHSRPGKMTNQNCKISSIISSISLPNRTRQVAVWMPCLAKSTRMRARPIALPRSLRSRNILPPIILREFYFQNRRTTELSPSTVLLRIMKIRNARRVWLISVSKWRTLSLRRNASLTNRCPTWFYLLASRNSKKFLTSTLVSHLGIMKRR